MRSATVVLPVPGLPVKLMCSEGRDEIRPSSRRSRSITSSAAISRMRVFTGSERDQILVELGEHLLDVALRRRHGVEPDAHRAGAPLPVDVPLAR